MGAYRCIFLDVSKHTRRVESAELPDDPAAIEWAAGLLAADPLSAAIEDWQLAHLVCRHERV